MENKPTYFVYARKSSEGADRQILSIEGQLNELQKFIERDSLSVIGTYTESKSAHVPNNRPAFNEMMQRIDKGEANGIIIWHINRISRNPKESGEIQQMLQDGKIVSIATPYRYFKTNDNALLFSIETSEANQYSRDLSVNVKRGLRQKYEMGHPPGIAPLGYLNTKSSIRGSNKIVVDNERWPIVRKGFDLILSGIYSVNKVLQILNNEYGLRTRPGNLRGGRPLSKAGFYRMLCDPFYYGVFYKHGLMYKGAYKPMLTAAEFDTIQIILGRKGRPREKKHAFAYTGLITCSVCGSAITASKKAKLIKSTNEIKYYTFYHCTHRKKGAEACTERSFIPVKVLEEQILEELKSYDVHPDFKNWAVKLMHENYQTEIDKANKLVEEQAGFEKRLNTELDNLIELRISNSITEEIYLRKKAEKEENLLRIRERNEALKSYSLSWMECLKRQLNFVTDIADRFKKSPLNVKKELCHDFGWNWTLKEKKLFISKAEWLQPIKKYKDGVEEVLQRLEPANNVVNKDQNGLLELVRPLVCGLIDEVRTSMQRDDTSCVIKSLPAPPVNHVSGIAA